MSQRYYFEIERPEKSAVTHAYIWREENDASTAPPVKEFHSTAENAEEIVSQLAARWIEEHGQHI